jgi:hypothetical protein
MIHVPRPNNHPELGIFTIQKQNMKFLRIFYVPVSLTIFKKGLPGRLEHVCRVLLRDITYVRPASTIFSSTATDAPTSFNIPKAGHAGRQNTIKIPNVQSTCAQSGLTSCLGIARK